MAFLFAAQPQRAARSSSSCEEECIALSWRCTSGSTNGARTVDGPTFVGQEAHYVFSRSSPPTTVYAFLHHHTALSATALPAASNSWKSDSSFTTYDFSSAQTSFLWCRCCGNTAISLNSLDLYAYYPPLPRCRCPAYCGDPSRSLCHLKRSTRRLHPLDLALRAYLA